MYMFVLYTNTLWCTVHPDQSIPCSSHWHRLEHKKPHFSLPISHPDRLTLSHANMHTHIPEVVSVGWGTELCALKEAWLSCLSQPSLSPSFTATRLCVFVHMYAHVCAHANLGVGNNPFSTDVCVYLLECVQICICTRLLTGCACQWPALCESSYPPPT